MRNIVTTAIFVASLAASAALAGPYSLGAGDPGNPYDPGVPGFVGPNGEGKTSGGNYVNPEFISWATGCIDYDPAPLGYDYWNIEVEGRDGDWGQASRALGPVTADRDDIVSLGDLYDPSDPPPAEWTLPEDPPGLLGIDPPGEITLTFESSVAGRVPIRNGVGADFAVFENGFLEEGPIYVFAELAYVEVSSNGADFVRFESDSLTPEPLDSYGDPLTPAARRQLTIDPTDVHNLAGKHVNGGSDSWGTPFDLDELVDHPDVIAGLVDLQQIRYVKIVDVPGSGYFLDADGDAIYDPWWTVGSGGFDLEALGVLNEMPDFDFDGDVDGSDLDILRDNLGSTDLRYDLDSDGDADADDLNYMIANNLQWVNGAFGGYGTVGGDFNLDGLVDTTDLARLAMSYGLDVGWADGNANFDNMVDTTDLAILAINYGYTTPGLDVVPEPASLGLLAAGALALVRRRSA